MFTKEQLEQFRLLIKEENENEGDRIREDLGAEIRLAFVQNNQRLKEIDTSIKNLSIKLTEIEAHIITLEKSVKLIKKNVNYLKKILDIVVKNYDEGDNILRKRITKIENYLHFPQTV